MKFTDEGLLPPGDYELSINELRHSILVEGPGNEEQPWDSDWRRYLVEQLEQLVKELWQIGVTEIFIDGSFVEDKAHPNDIDGYFVWNDPDISNLELLLNAINPHKVWTWSPQSRRPYKGYPKKQLPMWHKYRVELYPHNNFIWSGIEDEYGNNQQFPAAFRKTRDTFQPKGIVKILKTR